MRKILSIILCVIVALCSLIPAHAGVTYAETPVSAEEMQLKWSVKLGTSYRNAPSVPVVSDGYVYTMSRNKLYKIDAENGETVNTAEMCSEPSFGYTPVLAEKGKIFCPLENGTVQAFDAETMQSVWIFRDVLGGQALSPIASDGRYIYTGFWNDEELDANYVCIDSENGSLKWSCTLKGGFYWAEGFISGDYIIVGGDNGSADDSAEGVLHSLNKNTGEAVDTVCVKGDIRSGIAEYNDSLYAVTKAGYIYKTSIGSDGHFGEVYSAELSGASTSTPVVYDGKIYLGVQSVGFDGDICVLDADSLELIKTVPMEGYPQSEVLLTSAYEDVYIYSTYNALPGGITVISGSDYKTEQLFVPDEGSRSYCISTVVADENGNLYYKNDSGTIFAIGNKNAESEKSFMDIIFSLVKSIIKMLLLLFV